MMFDFCKIMFQKSINKAFYLDSGEKRPSDRLDYRYIDCTIKLIIVLMKTQNFNKHKFMIRAFDAIHEVLESDFKQSPLHFNQKPYYRMLMGLLIAFNRFPCFNPQTQ
mmetsp:Transcript_9015/g.8422  ORF Transcript_9015/g.8422 Transcript_9015/m.8422 type:complete len:108 (+) Transcript_9015:2482-2805(+)